MQGLWDGSITKGLYRWRGHGEGLYRYSGS